MLHGTMFWNVDPVFSGFIGSLYRFNVLKDVASFTSQNPPLDCRRFKVTAVKNFNMMQHLPEKVF